LNLSGDAKHTLSLSAVAFALAVICVFIIAVHIQGGRFVSIEYDSHISREIAKSIANSSDASAVDSSHMGVCHFRTWLISLFVQRFSLFNLRIPSLQRVCPD
jgi:hypothetical protein